MVWARIDDCILDNPKIAKAGVYGFALHVAGITWCCRNLSDGKIPYARVTALLTFDMVLVDSVNPLALPGGPQSSAGDTGLDPHMIAGHLVACGLWARTADGYEIHDFLEYNPSRDEVESKRAKTRDRQVKHRESRRESRDVSRKTSRSPSRVTFPLPDPDPDPDPRGDQDPDHDHVSAETKGSLVGDRGGPGGNESPTPAPLFALAAVTPSAPKRASRTRIDPMFQPTTECVAQLRTAGVSEAMTRRCVPEFVDYWLGKGELMADWQATFRNRVRDLAKWGKLPTEDTVRQPVRTISDESWQGGLWRFHYEDGVEVKRECLDEPKAGGAKQ